MQYFTLTNHVDNTIIFAGYYNSYIKCLEDAVKKKINLKHINLQNKNLNNANLDNAHMPCSLLNEANLTGANLSEANLIGCSFTNSSLYNTCLSYSDLSNCDFRSASFGATLIDGANIQGSIFSNISCFDLDFNLTKNMVGCLFASSDGNIHKMSRQPMIIKGFMNRKIIVLDNAIKIGIKMLPKNMLPDLIKTISNNILQNAINNNDATIYSSDIKEIKKYI